MNEEHEMNTLLAYYKSKLLKCKSREDVCNLLLTYNNLQYRNFLKKAVKCYYNKNLDLILTLDNTRYVADFFEDNCIKFEEGNIYLLKQKGDKK